MAVQKQTLIASGCLGGYHALRRTPSAFVDLRTTYHAQFSGFPYSTPSNVDDSHLTFRVAIRRSRHLFGKVRVILYDDLALFEVFSVITAARGRGPP